MVAAIEPMTIQKVVQIAGILTDKAIRNGSIKKNPEKRGNRGENLVRIGIGEMITRELGLGMLFLQPQTLLGERTQVRNPSVPPVTFTIHLRHPVALVSTVTVQDILLRIIEWCLGMGQGRGNNGNHARGKAFMLGAEEARQDPNIVTGTFTLNNHYATTLFDSGADFSFVSTTFIPLFGIEPVRLTIL
ncbi:hypothetical protein Tco_1228182 [Tanacetum coccineum]